MSLVDYAYIERSFYNRGLNVGESREGAVEL